MAAWAGLLKEYGSYLPITENTPALTLGEGNTPLIKLEHLSEEWGVELYVKYEGANPTGSFKDRGMVVAVAKAKEEGAQALICASTGNTSAAASAYGARAGLRSIVVIPKGKTALGKVAQAAMYGAEIIEIEGNFDRALALVRELCETEPIALVNSVNPYRLHGQKTAAFEICDALGAAPDVLAIPVGNAGNISAYWMGFKEYDELHQTGRPRMHGFEAEGAAAIVKQHVIEHPETIATAIRIGNPASWKLAVQAANESKGEIDLVTDEEIVDAYREIAKKEGIFAEPGSCASLAGLKKHIQAGKVAKGSKIVAVLTGNGLKDPTTAIDLSNVQTTTVEDSKTALADYLMATKPAVK
ncbi:threonine synthase [Shouchella clausii]|uniref:Threonine synthase n=1 Tax=Shouchella clausii TaxID=79880 RepID=A0A268S196_SHOCL|nr:threonine synthase [Shouchella clausii]PAD41103.1 threonine synthase [Bacillus sp. 7520-S]AST96860.1 threonine synthase [Shouchella clausii]MBU8597949.1 threonine synthase [Shouchella clausii]MCR1287196.1 threonine synthase [Shouchella clausii]MCY1105411.1 threonine synthase [Shouchella clausii]